MKYTELLERLGPLPTFTDVANYLGCTDAASITQLVRQGELEVIQVSTRYGENSRTKRRIVLNSLYEYLHKPDIRDRILALERREIKEVSVK
jgi:hypothetical protein